MKPSQNPDDTQEQDWPQHAIASRLFIKARDLDSAVYFAIVNFLACGAVAAAVVPLVLEDTLGFGPTSVHIVGWLVGYFWTMWCLASVWFNAYNTKSRFVAVLSRIIILLLALFVNGLMISDVGLRYF